MPRDGGIALGTGEFLVIFEVTRGPHAGQRFEFDRHDTFLVGRSPDAHLCLRDDPYFSRNHLRIEVTPPRCYLLDLASNNGTTVNGRKVVETFLSDGDIIAGGRTEIRVGVTRRTTKMPIEQHPTLVVPAPVAPLSGLARSSPISATGSGARPQIAGYDVLGEVGRGSMGIVYRATQKSTGAAVAVKVIHPVHTALPSQLQLFVRESQILSTMAHQHIIRFLEIGAADNRFFVATEYVETIPLQRVLEGQSLPAQIRICCGVACRVLDALQYAHQRSLVHRDIKPANILLSRQGRKLHTKLADFGLAKNFEDAGFSGITAESEIRGSPAYMAPEQVVSSRYAKPPCDLYSVGVTLYEFLTGKLPFERSTATGILRAILEDSPTPVRNVRPDIPEGLANVVERALAKDAADRFTSAQEMRRELLPYSLRATSQ